MLIFEQKLITFTEIMKLEELNISVILFYLTIVSTLDVTVSCKKQYYCWFLSYWCCSSTLPVSPSVSVVVWFPWRSSCVLYGPKWICGGCHGDKGMCSIKAAGIRNGKEKFLLMSDLFFWESPASCCNKVQKNGPVRTKKPALISGVVVMVSIKHWDL